MFGDGEDIDVLRLAYDAGVQEEYARLAPQSPMRYEFDTLKRAVGNACATSSTVLDIGSGPGRYAEWLAGEGHRVGLVDISANALRAFRDRYEGDGDRVLFATQCCATKLDWVPSCSADCLLLMGPLYHLVGREERERVLFHCRRILAAHGTLFAAFLGTSEGSDECPHPEQVSHTWFAGYRVPQYRCRQDIAVRLLEGSGFAVRETYDFADKNGKGNTGEQFVVRSTVRIREEQRHGNSQAS